MREFFVVFSKGETEAQGEKRGPHRNALNLVFFSSWEQNFSNSF